MDIRSLQGLSFQEKTQLRLHCSNAVDQKIDSSQWFSLEEVGAKLADSTIDQEDCLTIVAGKGYNFQSPFSITKTDFQQLVKEQKLHHAFTQRLHRDNGSLAYFTDYEEVDGVFQPFLSIIIRSPFSPYNDISCVLRVNINTQSTFLLFFARSEENITDLLTSLNTLTPQTNGNTLHRSLIAIFELYSSTIEKHRAALDKEVQSIETKTGQTSLTTRRRWERDPYRYEFLTREMHTCNNNLVFLENLSFFEKDMGVLCNKVMDVYFDLRGQGNHGPISTWERDRAHQYLHYYVDDATTRQRLIQCLKMRVQTQINLMYSLISQRDTKANMTIAEAAQKDSRTMKTIALMTLIFLPGTLITSLFSTDLFNLRAGETDNDDTFVARYWWILFVVAVVLTVFVVGFWLIWERRRRRKQNGTLLGKSSFDV